MQLSEVEHTKSCWKYKEAEETPKWRPNGKKARYLGRHVVEPDRTEYTMTTLGNFIKDLLSREQGKHVRKHVGPFV